MNEMKERPKSVIRVVPRVSLRSSPVNRTGAATAGSASRPSATVARRRAPPRMDVVYTPGRGATTRSPARRVPSARRPAPVPVGHALVRVPRREHVRLGERPPDELEPDRPPVAREPARQRERRQPGQVEGTREATDRLQRAHLGVADTHLELVEA